jgi:hypothetical protein
MLLRPSPKAGVLGKRAKGVGGGRLGGLRSPIPPRMEDAGEAPIELSNIDAP